MKHRYKQDILDRAVKNNPKIILPEVDDNRVLSAIKELKSIGFDVIDPRDLNNNKFEELASNKTFANNWTDEMIKTYLEA